MSSTYFAGYDSLHSTLNGSIQALDGLRELLELEFDVLAKNDTAALQSITQKKQVFLEHLQNQQKLWQSLGKNDDEDFSQGASLSESETEALRQALAGVQYQNQINARVIALSEQHTRELLGVLTGQANVARLYSAKGKTHESHLGRLLGEV